MAGGEGDIVGKNGSLSIAPACIQLLIVRAKKTATETSGGKY
jgi:hypothetical protein